MNAKTREPTIHPTAYVADSVELGDWSTIGPRAQICGSVTIGRDAWICEDTVIGGGQLELGKLKAGDFLHLGIRGTINIADAVTIGNEVGMRGEILTHGSYLNELDGFPFVRGPVTIGNRVWLPCATVLPNVRIGNNVVIAAVSLVNKDIPDGCLAGGVPAKILRHNAYPKVTDTLQFLNHIKADAKHYGVNAVISGTSLFVGRAMFFPNLREIRGCVTNASERVKDLFRRRGVRFRYYDNNGEYTKWD